MSQVVVRNISVSLDGYAAGPDQGREHPLGIGGERLHEWAFATRTIQRMFGNDGGARGVDDDVAARAQEGVGAFVMGRNMFGPVRGPWEDDQWRGWWGEDPPYHRPVFVLTHHPRPSLPMEGGTTFHFVDDGIESALRQAREAAGAADVMIAGGASTIRRYMRAGLIDELRLTLVPALMGGGERLLGHADDGPLGYTCVEHSATPAAVHLRLVRTDDAG